MLQWINVRRRGASATSPTVASVRGLTRIRPDGSIDRATDGPGARLTLRRVDLPDGVGIQQRRGLRLRLRLHDPHRKPEPDGVIRVPIDITRHCGLWSPPTSPSLPGFIDDLAVLDGGLRRHVHHRAGHVLAPATGALVA